jgi:hypothetical protein
MATLFLVKAFWGDGLEELSCLEGPSVALGVRGPWQSQAELLWLAQSQMDRQRRVRSVRSDAPRRPRHSQVSAVKSAPQFGAALWLRNRCWEREAG